jgi:hypothetical protein
MDKDKDKDKEKDKEKDKKDKKDKKEKEKIYVNVLLKDILIFDDNSKEKYIDIKDHSYYKALKENDSNIYLKYVNKMNHQKEKDTGTWSGFIELYNNIKKNGFELKNTGSIKLQTVANDKYCCFHGRHRICMMRHLYNDNTVLTLKNNKVCTITQM